MWTTRQERPPGLALVLLHPFPRAFPKPKILETPALTPNITRIRNPKVRNYCSKSHPDSKTSMISKLVEGWASEYRTHTNKTHPSHVEWGSLTPTPGDPNLAYARKTCAIIEPSLPAAADMPWQVQRYFVGNTSAAI
jgi:hypothetical protein